MSNVNLKRKLDDINVSNSTLLNYSEVLNEKLSHRPDRNQLISKGILHDSHCAPSLQNAEHALKRARLADELNTHLLNRPGPLDLIQNHILHIDTNEHPHLEQAIQDGEIPFKKTPSTTSRPLIFHEYTGPPSSCKPKITKMDRLKSSSNVHQIRLAQQQLLLQLTSEKDDEKSCQTIQKPLEQMTKIELRDLCKQYQIPSSHSNKTTLIQRIKQTQQKIHEQKSLANQTFEDDLFSSLQLNEQIQPFSTKELDEILQSIPIDFFNQEKDQTTTTTTNSTFDINQNQSTSNNNDQLFLQFLLDNDVTTATTQTNTFDHLFPTDYYLPKITNIDEFDAFLTDFTTSSSSLFY